MKLDRSRPFGTIHPHHNGAAFEQDGVFFDVYERAINPPKAKARKADPKPEGEAAETNPPAGETNAAGEGADAGAGETPPAAGEAGGEAAAAGADESIMTIGQSAPDPRAKK